jgi:hypothetical protein
MALASCKVRALAANRNKTEYQWVLYTLQSHKFASLPAPRHKIASSRAVVNVRMLATNWLVMLDRYWFWQGVIVGLSYLFDIDLFACEQSSWEVARF